MKLPTYTNSQVEFCIDEYIHNEMHRAMLKRYLIDGRTYSELAEEFNYSIRQIARIIYKNEQVLFKHL